MNEQLSIGEILAEIRTELVRRQTKGSDASNNQTQADTVSAQPLSPPQLARYIPQSDFDWSKDKYHINDFLQFHDRQFIINAYRGIIGREPDGLGLTHYLGLLRSGVSKAYILGRLRLSKEGRKKGRYVSGLAIPFMFSMLYQIPIIGYFVRWVTAILRLPKLVRAEAEFQAYVLSLNTQITDFINNNQHKLESIFRDYSLIIDDLDTRKVDSDLLYKLQQRVEECKTELAKMQSRHAALSKDKADTYLVTENQVALKSMSMKLKDIYGDIQSLSSKKVDQSQLDERVAELIILQEEIRSQNKFINQALEMGQSAIADITEVKSWKQEIQNKTPEKHTLDAFYLKLEDAFRGTRDDIKERFRIYLPYVQKSNMGTQQRPVLDIACGRGEWLELLKAEGLVARGVDDNAIMVKQCKESGLDVEKDDLLSYLKAQPAQSIGMVTGFHIIEHLDFESLMVLVDEVLRVLCSDGIAIFETPNPENLLVSSLYFYFDPTHRHPVVPEVIDFLMKERGFENVSIKRLHKYSELFQINDDDVFRNQWFYNEMDYAVIGKKK